MAVCTLLAGPPFAARLLESDPKYVSLPDPRDQALAQNLVTTVQIGCGHIDAVLSEFCDRYYTPKNRRRGGGSAAAACLRVGAAQILFLDVSPHAAVKDTVDAIKIPYRGGGARAAPLHGVKFANAVMRRVQREGKEIMGSRTSSSDNLSGWLMQE